MEAWIADALTTKRAIPTPRPESKHSGRLLLRMPQTLHCELAQAADSRETSLNSFITSSLTRAVGVPGGEEAEHGARPPHDEGGTGSSESRRFRRAMAANLIVVGFVGIAAVILLILAWAS